MSAVVMPIEYPALVGVMQSGTSHEEVALAWQDGLMDVVELRLDTFSPSKIKSIVTEFVDIFPEIPTIATIRSQVEGGEWLGPDTARLALYEELLPLVSCIDVEWLSPNAGRDGIDLAHRFGKEALVSYHQYDAPIEFDFLSHIIEDGFESGADLVKISCMVHSDADYYTLEYLLHHFNYSPVSIIGMGPLGVESRKLFPAMGSRLAYASIGQPSAPGQLSVAEMRPFVTPNL